MRLEAVLKIMKNKSAELDADHGDKDPNVGAGLGGFVIADQPALEHQPTEGAFHDPAARQAFEARGNIGTFNDCYRQLAGRNTRRMSTYSFTFFQRVSKLSKNPSPIQN
jgi:hypothetical protein